MAVLLLAAMAASIAAQPGYRTKHMGLPETCGLPHPPDTTVTLTGAQATVNFSPGGHGEAMILRAISAAQHSILIQAYSFTDRRILSALGTARARGVDVRVILDKTDTQWYEGHAPLASVLRAKQIPVWIDTSVNIAHNKVMIIDSRDLITGSYNFTYAAAYDNAENLLLIRNAPKLVGAYISNWYWRRSCSKPYSGQPLH